MELAQGLLYVDRKFICYPYSDELGQEFLRQPNRYNKVCAVVPDA